MKNTSHETQHYLSAIEAAEAARKQNRPRRWLAQYAIAASANDHRLPDDLKLLIKEYKAIKKEFESQLPKYQSGEQLTTYRLLS